MQSFLLLSAQENTCALSTHAAEQGPKDPEYPALHSLTQFQTQEGLTLADKPS